MNAGSGWVGLCPVCSRAGCFGPLQGLHPCTEPRCGTKTQGGREGWVAHLKVVHGVEVPRR